MPIPVLELPLVLASLALQPSAPTPHHRCGGSPATVADCCVHPAAWDSLTPNPPLALPSAQTASADERTKRDVPRR
jgi:hypothetical protein